jgi:hypothetical protein
MLGHIWSIGTGLTIDPFLLPPHEGDTEFTVTVPPGAAGMHHQSYSLAN